MKRDLKSKLSKHLDVFVKTQNLSFARDRAVLPVTPNSTGTNAAFKDNEA